MNTATFSTPRGLMSSSKRQNNYQIHKEVEKHGNTGFELGTV